MLERPQLRLKCYPSCDFYCRGNVGKGLKKKPVEKLAGKRAELYPGERDLKWDCGRKYFWLLDWTLFYFSRTSYERPPSSKRPDNNRADQGGPGMRWRLRSLVRDTSISAEPGEKPF